MEKVKLKGLSLDVVLYLSDHPDTTNSELMEFFKKGRYMERVLSNLHNRFGTFSLSQGDTKEARKKLVQKCVEWRDTNGSEQADT